MASDFPDYIRSIHHDGSRQYVHSLGSDRPGIGDEVLIRVRTGVTAPIERVLLRTCPDGEQFFTEMKVQTGNPACNWWEAPLKLTMPVVGYRFLIFTANGAWFYNASGAQRAMPTDAHDFKLLPTYQPPEWVHQSVFYQIFPDRFMNGNPANNVHTGEYDYRGSPAQAREWGERPGHGHAAMVEFFGGDLEGISQRLDHLLDLGVNAIYLNPIFTAQSNHRYDVIDYYHVDPHLGGDAALADLRRVTQQAGLRLILDIVPNHCGIAHPWFQQARQDPNAPTAEFFTFYQHPDDYESWLGVKGLPKLNYRSRALREVMYAGPQAVFRYWLRPPYSIDGWRLDVANMLARQGADQMGQEVSQGIRQAVKEENPQAYVLGENFFDATSQLQGDTYDAAMNYWGFNKPLRYWLTRFEIHQHSEPRMVGSKVPWPTQALVDSWQGYLAGIPWVIAQQQFNLLGSHDIPRMLTFLNGSMPHKRLAAAVLLTYVGTPCIYYGDEIGMGADPQDTSRDCMIWERQRWNEDLYAFYRTLVHLRRTAPALLEGGFQVLAVEENCLAYLRDSANDKILVIANRGPETRAARPLPVAHGAIADGAQFVELMSGRRAVVTGGGLPLDEIPAGVEIWRSHPYSA